MPNIQFKRRESQGSGPQIGDGKIKIAEPQIDFTTQHLYIAKVDKENNIQSSDYISFLSEENTKAYINSITPHIDYDSISSNIIPVGTTYSLGNSTNYWNTIYAKTIYENGKSLSTTYASKTHTHSYIPLSGSTAISGNLVPKATDKLTLGSPTYKWLGLFSKNISTDKIMLNGLDITTLLPKTTFIQTDGQILNATCGYFQDSKSGLLICFGTSGYLEDNFTRITFAKAFAGEPIIISQHIGVGTDDVSSIGSDDINGQFIHMESDATTTLCSGFIIDRNYCHNIAYIAIGRKAT